MGGAVQTLTFRLNIRTVRRTNEVELTRLKIVANPLISDGFGGVSLQGPQFVFGPAGIANQKGCP